MPALNKSAASAEPDHDLVPRDLFARPAEEAARRLALRSLDEAHRVAERLRPDADGNALHEFRVAVRRLRSLLKAWRPELATCVPKKAHRTLRQIQQVTGPGRDAEVLLEWLEPHRAHLDLAHRSEVDALVTRLRSRRDRAYAKSNRRAQRRFLKAVPRLDKALAHLTTTRNLRRTPTPRRFGPVLAITVQAHATEVTSRLARVESLHHTAALHSARLAAKRLRYLVEPLRRQDPHAQEIVQRSKSLQTLLGRMQDLAVLEGVLAETIGVKPRRLRRWLRNANPGRRAQAHAGLVELARRAQDERVHLFGELERQWLGPGARQLQDPVERFVARLETPAGRNLPSAPTALEPQYVATPLVS